MVNTYTSAGLIKQDYDTNDDIWGDFENTNKDIQQSLIAGYLQVSLAAGDVTLTDVDGVDDQAKNHIFETTGTIPANRNLIVPNKERHFKVKNSCVGSFTVTVKTAAGTGIVVPVSGVADLICDGTNVIEGTTYIGTLRGTLNMQDNTLQRSTLRDYAHTASIVASSSTAVTVNVETANTWQITLDANCTITLQNPSPSGSECVIRIRTIQDATGGRTHTFAGGTIKWLGQIDQSVAPTIVTTANYINEFEFRTLDGGTIYTAQLVGSSSSESPLTSGVYVAVGTSGKLASATDGLDWALQSIQFSGTEIIGINAYDNTFQFYSAVGGLAEDIGKFTTDGTSFTDWGALISVQSKIYETALASNNTAFQLKFQAAYAGSNGMFSTDNWSTVSPSGGMTITNGRTYVGAYNGNDVAWLDEAGSASFSYSTDGGASGTTVPGTSVTVGAFAYLNGYYVVGTQAGAIYYKVLVSTGTLTSASFTISGSNRINKLIWTGSKWIACANAGKVANASAIDTWSDRTTGLSGNIVAVANNGAIVVVVTDAGEIARSADHGDSWSVLSTPTNNPFGGSALKFIKYRLNTYWTGGEDGKLGYSSDGTSFSLVTSGFGSDTINDMEVI